MKPLALALCLPLLSSCSKATTETAPVEAAKPTANAETAAATTAAGAKGSATVCDCRLLTKHAFADVIAGTAHSGCSTNLLDGADCEQYDRLRNCIYAAHGYQFRKKRYQEHFSQFSWYKPNPDFNESVFSTVESLNVAQLKRTAQTCREQQKAAGATLSERDKTVLATWLKTKRAPKLVWMEDAPADASLIADRVQMRALDTKGYRVSVRKEPTADTLQKALEGTHYRTIDVSACNECEGASGAAPGNPACADAPVQCHTEFQLVVSDKDEILAIYLTVAAG